MEYGHGGDRKRANGDRGGVIGGKLILTRTAAVPPRRMGTPVAPADGGRCASWGLGASGVGWWS